MDESQRVILNAVRGYMTKRDNWQAAHRLADAGLMMPEQAMKRSDMSQFVILMDDATRELMGAIPDMTPPEWESLLELLPNVRKLLGQTEGEGSWGG